MSIDKSKLSETARETIANLDNELLVSPAVYWEIAIKIKLVTRLTGCWLHRPSWNMCLSSARTHSLMRTNVVGDEGLENFALSRQFDRLQLRVAHRLAQLGETVAELDGNHLDQLANVVLKWLRQRPGDHPETGETQGPERE